MSPDLYIKNSFKGFHPSPLHMQAHKSGATKNSHAAVHALLSDLKQWLQV